MKWKKRRSGVIKALGVEPRKSMVLVTPESIPTFLSRFLDKSLLLFFFLGTTVLSALGVCLFDVVTIPVSDLLRLQFSNPLLFVVTILTTGSPSWLSSLSPSKVLRNTQLWVGLYHSDTLLEDGGVGWYSLGPLVCFFCYSFHHSWDVNTSNTNPGFNVKTLVSH